MLGELVNLKKLFKLFPPMGISKIIGTVITLSFLFVILIIVFSILE